MFDIFEILFDKIEIFCYYYRTSFNGTSYLLNVPAQLIISWAFIDFIYLQAN